ncbi:MAG: isoprenylcysteine carboxylmethyltransferase family protein [Theionarchaea archaeon]|nr:isoprenylcysteine carboxylmethyltransferase family protein [Theionarchaea archaeon]
MKESQPVKPWHIIFSIFFTLLFPAAFFVLAGDFTWIEGWIFTIILLAWVSALLIYLVKKDPELFRERLVLPIQKEKKEGQDIQQKRWDKPIVAILFTFYGIWIVGMPLDAKRFALSPEFPVLAKVIGVIFLNGGLTVSTGIYCVVRHPLYLGGILWTMGTPLLFGSLIGIGFTIGMSILFAIRAVKEERMLADELEGYDEYRKKVRYRIIPFLF